MSELIQTSWKLIALLVMCTRNEELWWEEHSSINILLDY
jgi:hypothetical protein